jgi:hypothetical protein
VADEKGNPPFVMKLQRMGHPVLVMILEGFGCLFGGHFFLFAFHAHEFEFALFGFEG